MTTGLSIPKDITSCQNAACNWEIATNESLSRLLQVPRLAAILCDDDCKSLSSLSQEAITVVPEFLLTIYKHFHAPHYDNTAMQWPRMIQARHHCGHEPSCQYRVVSDRRIETIERPFIKGCIHSPYS